MNEMRPNGGKRDLSLSCTRKLTVSVRVRESIVEWLLISRAAYSGQAPAFPSFGVAASTAPALLLLLLEG